MYRVLKDFIKDWEYETEVTLKMLDNLTDDSLKQRVTPEGRTLGYIAWHLVLTIGEMMGKTGLTPDAPAEDTPVPAHASKIRNAFEKAARSILSQIEEKWNDNTLFEEVPMYGESWQNGVTLKALVMHQTHHRGQMTVLMRQAGLKVPGAYGPSKEEWAAMGMEAPF